MVDRAWFVSGEAISAWTRPRHGLDAMPPPQSGIRSIGPWALVSATRAEESPVGPFLELAVAVPAHHGLHLGLTVVGLVVDRPDALLAARTRWGLPAMLGRLRWGSLGDRFELRWENADLSLVGTATGRPRPLVTGSRVLQRRSDGVVLATRSHRAMRRRAQVVVKVDAGPWAPLAGTWRGRRDSSLKVVTHRARRPATAPFTEPAPHTTTEPALAGPGGSPAILVPSREGSRAHSSAG